MAGVRRRLRDVGKTVSGVLTGRPGAAEPPVQDGPCAAGPPGTGPDALLGGDAGPAAVPPVAGEPVPDTGGPAPDAIVPHHDVEESPVPPVAPELDPALAAAVDLALLAAREVGGRRVGEHLGVEAEGVHGDGPLASHAFATTDRAYRGWRWTVTVARAEGSDHVTVDEVVLLPGAGALLAPAWVPWSDRVTAGDLTAGDLLPPPSGDERLALAWADPEADLADELFWELGLGRPRVLSLEGRADAAERWWEGEAGPHARVTEQAPGLCGDCGFLVPLGGALRQAFGVCANGFAPDDGRVVALAHGCGAHSETVVDGSHAATAGMAVEDDEFDLTPVTALREAADVDVDVVAEAPAEVVLEVAPGTEVVLDVPAGAEVVVEVPTADAVRDS